MRRLSYREFLGWVYFLDSNWNEPNRSDYYLMAIRAELEAIRLGTTKLDGDLNNKKIKFNSSSTSAKSTHQNTSTLTKEQIQANKEAWRARRNSK